MHRFYCPPENITTDRAAIRDHQQINHIRKVLRLKLQDKIQIFDGEGNESQGLIQEMNKDDIKIKIQHKSFVKKTSPAISIAVALPKNVKMDYIVEKLTELGADKIMPMLTKRTIVNLDVQAKKDKVARWRKIAINASEQSQRSYLPQVAEIEPMQKVLKAQPTVYDLRLIPTLYDKRKKLKEALKNSYKNILVLIGPEGDFTPQEVKGAQDAGFMAVDFGDTVLKVDTACIYIISILKYVCR